MPKLLKKLSILILIFSWIFAGWPQIFNFPPEVQVAHAATATKTWSFAADAESWTATLPNPNNTDAQWQSADGSPANGSLQMRLSIKNKTETGRIWEIAGTWEAIFGIPANSTVTEVGSGTGNSYNYRISEYTSANAGESGPFAFYDNTPTLVGTFSTAAAFSGLVAWTAKTGAAISVPAGLQASNNTVRFRITNKLATTNTTGAAVTLRQDQIVLTITYTANSAPNAPSQDSPANSATGVSVTPTFLMTATDPDSNNVGYKVTIYSNSICTTVVQTNDQAVSSTGWTGSNATCTASPTACYTSGTQGSFLTQTALSNSTQYWWKASAKDPDGSGTFTDSSTCNTFTTATAAQTLTFSFPGGNTVALGPLSPTAVTTGSHTILVGTNATNGVAVTYSGSTLTSGANTINACAANCTDAGGAGQGTEQFGMNAVANTSPSVGVACSGTPPIASAATNYATANSFRFVSGDTIVSSAGTINDTTCTISYIANIANITEAGSYSATLTYVATATF